MSEVTINELEELAANMAKLRAEVDEDKKLLSEKNAKLEEIENKFLGYLKELNKTSYKSNSGTITRVEK